MKNSIKNIKNVKNEYLKEEKNLKNALKNYNTEIFYIGNIPFTDSPGRMTDECVIQIAVGVEELEEMEKIIETLKKMGYYYDNLFNHRPYYKFTQMLTKFRNNIFKGHETHVVYVQYKYNAWWRKFTIMSAQLS